MKIANKISLFILFFLAVFGLNTCVSLVHLGKIGAQLSDVVNRDLVLTEISAAITRYQLEKAVLFERLLRVSEEISFEKIPDSRREYLLDQTRVIEQGLDHLSATINQYLQKGKILLQENLQQTTIPQKKIELNNVQASLAMIEQAHQQYDVIFKEMIGAIQAGGYDVSFEDINRTESKENHLTAELKSVMEEIDKFTSQSLMNANHEQWLAKQILVISFSASMCLSFIVAFLIIRRISRPLRNLADAAHQIGSGNFISHLDEASQDEIGEVSVAFNAMSRELANFKSQLENKNKILAQSLEITKKQKRDLEKVNQELDLFVHTVSHDIGAPLMGIAWYGAYLEKHYKERLDQKGKDSLAGICKGTARLNAMITDLLTLTRISRIEHPYQSVSIESIIEAVKERLEFNIKRYCVDLQVQSSLPPIVCDRIKMVEAFFNLISNAIKFSSKNTQERPRVEIGYMDGGEWHEIYVKDNGIGIAPENHEKIFGVFKRVEENHGYDGAGIGLTIVKQVIADHGGKVWVQSQLGQGAAFHFTIPKNLRPSGN